jgi:hypothetical protein
MHRAVDVGFVVQENTLVELDDVVVVALALEVIVDDETDVMVALAVLETVLEAVVQFEISLAPCTLDAEIAVPTELFR